MSSGELCGAGPTGLAQGMLSPFSVPSCLFPRTSAWSRCGTYYYRGQGGLARAPQSSSGLVRKKNKSCSLKPVLTGSCHTTLSCVHTHKHTPIGFLLGDVSISGRSHVGWQKCRGGRMEREMVESKPPFTKISPCVFGFEMKA